MKKEEKQNIRSFSLDMKRTHAHPEGAAACARLEEFKLLHIPSFVELNHQPLPMHVSVRFVKNFVPIMPRPVSTVHTFGTPSLDCPEDRLVGFSASEICSGSERRAVGYGQIDCTPE